MPAENENVLDGDEQVQQQAQAQTGRRQIRLRVDERTVKTSYANAFRTHASLDEVILDLGLNMPNPVTQGQERADMVFQVNDRVIMNFHSAKRLAIALGQIIRRYEEQFGELKLNPDERRKDAAK